MDTTTCWLSLNGKSDAVVCLWPAGNASTFRWEAGVTGAVAADLMPDGLLDIQPCPMGVFVPLTGGADRIRRLSLTNKADAPVRVRFHCDEVFPFVLPGPGVVPSRFPQGQPTLRLGDPAPFTLWCDVPDSLDRLTLRAVLRPTALPEVIRLRAQLNQTLSPDPGWYCGEHHMDSYFEDGARGAELCASPLRTG